MGETHLLIDVGAQPLAQEEQAFDDLISLFSERSDFILGFFAALSMARWGPLSHGMPYAGSLCWPAGFLLDDPAPQATPGGWPALSTCDGELAYGMLFCLPARKGHI